MPKFDWDTPRLLSLIMMKTIRLNPDEARAYYNRGVAKSELGKYFEAISDYDEAIRLNPE